MKSAYRGHYEPATQQILPDADPYIAALVLEACAAQRSTAMVNAVGGLAYSGLAGKSAKPTPIYHGPAYHGSTDPRSRLVGEAAPPLVSEPATRTDRRQSLGRSSEFSHRGRRILFAARG